MRILLITPPGGFTSKEPMPPLGLLYLAAALRTAGHEVTVRDYTVRRPPRRAFRRDLEDLRPQALGISVLTESRFAAAAAARLAKRLLPGVRVIVGGAHPSGAPDDTARCPHFDVVVTGQAETAIVGALTGSKRIVRGTAPDDLDDLPMPALDLLPPDERLFSLDLPGCGRQRTGHLVTARGCPFDCAFCATAATHGRTYRAHSIDRVMEEIERLRREGAEALWFYDDVFNASAERVAALCEALRRLRPAMPFVASIRTDLATREQLARMRADGCVRLFFGVEEKGDGSLLCDLPAARLQQAGAPEGPTGKRLPSPFSVACARAVARWCDELGIEKNPGYILGLPGETPGDAQRTLDLMRELGGRPSVSFLRIYPGTRIERLAVERGLLPAGFSWWDSRAFRGLVCRPAFGDTPIFLNGLTWADVGALAQAWAWAAGEPLRRRAWAALIRTRSFPDFTHLVQMARGGRHDRLTRPSAAHHLARAARAAMSAALRFPQPLNRPLELWIEPTDACPGGCVVCPQKQGRPRQPRFMDAAVFDRALAAARLWQPRVNLHHRGEPFLHPRIVPMIRLLAAAGAPVTLHTGAHVPLPAPPATILNAGLTNLVVSLGAASPAAFARLRPAADRSLVICQARQLLAARRNGRTRITVELFKTGDWRREVRHARTLFAETLPDAIRLRPLHNWAGALDKQRGPTPFSVKSRCMFPFYAMVVLCDGRVTACPQDSEARLVVGSLPQNALAEVWQSEALRRLRHRTRDDLAETVPCASCSLLKRPGVFGLPMTGLAGSVRRKVLGP